MPTKPTILVVGGAGYIGSHMVLTLKQAGFTPVVIDNLSTGHREALFDTPFIEADVGNQTLLESVFQTHQIAAVMHFASFIEVNESVRDPAKYYQNNVSATLTLLAAMLKYGVNRFIFSSTAAVYGEPHYLPIDEQHPINPVNPYGRSKWMIEKICEDYANAYGLQVAILRYFNAAGAHPEGLLRERHHPETHLIPRILQSVFKNEEPFTLFGDDYPTADGTCVRDYVHVMDLCRAHLQALQALLRGAENIVCNLGTGRGYTVREVIKTVESILCCRVPIRIQPKRSGDPASLIANPARAKKVLTWQPHYTDLKTIVEHALWGIQKSEKVELKI